ncbi:hypothetical protein BJ741DRAFT_664135 [Chytriomyces cf. hyalinus JEL632]|nr:hypothetical protein BJ741DRAFT_664135 [Chytriomyces cf. hyalinus JEL632]
MFSTRKGVLFQTATAADPKTNFQYQSLYSLSHPLDALAHVLVIKLIDSDVSDSESLDSHDTDAEKEPIVAMTMPPGEIIICILDDVDVQTIIQEPHPCFEDASLVLTHNCLSNAYSLWVFLEHREVPKSVHVPSESKPNQLLYRVWTEKSIPQSASHHLYSNSAALPFWTFDVNNLLTIWFPATSKMGRGCFRAYKFSFTASVDSLISSVTNSNTPAISCISSLILEDPSIKFAAPMIVSRASHRDVVCLAASSHVSDEMEFDQHQLDELLDASTHASLKVWMGFDRLQLMPCWMPGNELELFLRDVIADSASSVAGVKVLNHVASEEDQSNIQSSRLRDVCARFSEGVPATRVVKSCWEALRHVLPAKQFVATFTRFVGFKLMKPLRSKEDEFQLFVKAVVFSFGGCLNLGNGATGQVEDEESANDVDEWEEMMLRGRTLGFASAFSYDDQGTFGRDGKLPDTGRTMFSALKHDIVESGELDDSLTEFAEVILVALHLVGENLMLDRTSNERNDLIQFCYDIAIYVKWDSYAKYCVKNGADEHGERLFQGEFETASKLNPDFSQIRLSPPNILEWVLHRMTTREPADFLTLETVAEAFDTASSVHPFNVSYTSNCDRMIRKVTCIFNLLITEDMAEIVECITHVGLSLKDLDCVPFGIAVPLKEFLYACRKTPMSGWEASFYALIGREDFAEQLSGTTCPRMYNAVPLAKRLPASAKRRRDPEPLSGVEIENSEICDLRFNGDDRIEAVQRIMTCHQVPSLNAKIVPDSTEEFIRSEQQQILTSFSNKMFALPFGRTLLTFETSKPTLDEFVSFPPVTVSAKMPPLQEVIHLDPTQAAPDLFDWPNFHNGVSTGLRISRESVLSGSWMVQNIPATPTCNHAGLVFALGLKGSLRNLEQWQLMFYLSAHHCLTTVGVLLGVAVSYRGTGDAFATRLMSVHVPRLNKGTGSSGAVGGGGAGAAATLALQIANGGVTFTASVFGLGLVYMGTARRRYVEVLLDEIAAVDYVVDDGRDNGMGTSGSFNERAKNREGHSVAAGLALGMVVLGRGAGAKGLAGLLLLERLVGYITGSRRRNESGSVGAGENDSAAGGATIAIALMFLKTNDEAVAAKLSMPETRHMLDYVRSDLLLVRALSRNLILWDAMTPTLDWVENQIPEYIRDKAALFDQDDGSLESLRHARYNIIAGACLSLGIKCAGSSDETVFRLLLAYLNDFNVEAGLPAITYREKLNKSVARTCCDVILLSLGVVMAGSGNLELLRRLHPLTDRTSSDTSYGSQMALQMALGFLFLGSANGLTLGTSNAAVAALVCALYPRFPMTADDNCSHLQPLRHMWVLAVERRRAIIARDVESRQACLLPLLITLKPKMRGFGKENEPLVLKAPCVLPDLSLIESVAIASKRYLPLKLEFGVDEAYLSRLFETHTLFVKRRPGALDYLKDPTGQMGILSRSFPSARTAPSLPLKEPPRKSKNPHMSEQEDFLDFILSSFSQDARLLAVAQHLCASPLLSAEKSDLGFADFCLRALRECLVEDKADLVELYIAIYSLVKNARSKMVVEDLFSLEIIITFYESVVEKRACAWLSQNSRLLNALFVGSLRCHLDALFLSDSSKSGVPSSIEEQDARYPIHLVIAPRPTQSSHAWPQGTLLAKVYNSMRRDERILPENVNMDAVKNSVMAGGDELAMKILEELMHG